MPLPTLRPMQIAQPQPMNAFLVGRQAAQGIEKHNWLRAQESRAAEAYEIEKADRPRKLQYEKLGKRFNALSMAFRAQSKEQAEQILTSLWDDPNEKPNILMYGPTVKFQMSDGELIEGPRESVVQVLTEMSKNPEYLDDETFQAHFKAFLKGQNISITQGPSAGKGTEAERDYATYTAGGGKLSKSDWKVAEAVKKKKALDKAVPPKPTGELTEGAVLENFREVALYLSDDPEKKTTEMWDLYLRYTKEGLSRADALNKVQKDQYKPKVEGDYSHLWNELPKIEY